MFLVSLAAAAGPRLSVECLSDLIAAGGERAVPAVPAVCGADIASRALRWPAEVAVAVAQRADADGCRALAGDKRVGVQNALAVNAQLPSDVAEVLLKKRKNPDTTSVETLIRRIDPDRLAVLVENGTVDALINAHSRAAYRAVIKGLVAGGHWQLLFDVMFSKSAAYAASTTALRDAIVLGDCAGTFTITVASFAELRRLGLFEHPDVTVTATLPDGTLTVDLTITRTFSCVHLGPQTNAGALRNAILSGRTLTREDLEAVTTFDPRIKVSPASAVAIAAGNALDDSALEFLREMAAAEVPYPLVVDVLASGLDPALTATFATATELPAWMLWNPFDADNNPWLTNHDLVRDVATTIAATYVDGPFRSGLASAAVAAGLRGPALHVLLARDVAAMCAWLRREDLEPEEIEAATVAARPDLAQWLAHELRDGFRGPGGAARCCAALRSAPGFGAVAAWMQHLGRSGSDTREKMDRRAANAIADTIRAALDDVVGDGDVDAVVSVMTELVDGWDGSLNELVACAAAAVH